MAKPLLENPTEFRYIDSIQCIVGHKLQDLKATEGIRNYRKMETEFNMHRFVQLQHSAVVIPAFYSHSLLIPGMANGPYVKDKNFPFDNQSSRFLSIRLKNGIGGC